nr:E3 ubiquitin-protein ligase MARCHF11-like [Manis javanica]
MLVFFHRTQTPPCGYQIDSSDMSRLPHPPPPPPPHNFLTPPESPRPRRNLEEPLVQLLQNLTLQELQRPRRRYPVPPQRLFATSTRSSSSS